METHKTYVSIETAKLLKQAGFDWDCKDKFYDFTNHCETYKKPTLEVARKWLREIKHYNLEIKILSITGGCLCWYYKVYKLEYCNGVYYEVKFLVQSEITMDTYELASDEGIQKCLTIILEEQQNEETNLV
jgi:hypothetical protein